VLCAAKEGVMSDNDIYEEKLSSRRTEALFWTLSLLFLLLTLWRAGKAHFEILSFVFLCLCLFFLFYALNYRTLVIKMTQETLSLKFGVIKWVVPIETIQKCYPDNTPLWRIGGAGIHFSMLQRRYRAMFNFLEYPRVVIELKEKRGLLRDIAFSTRHPGEVIRRIQASTTGGREHIDPFHYCLD
jgi:hypothetical protein